ncbi:uncharacterized protein [Ranitomeya imitator]|uniref:uncharacterized protein isoform X2 n=1 Tax=Ranitomeya imitator TaxID=111125 RepID=UPI0037E7022A
MAVISPHSADEAQYMDPVRQNLVFEGFLKKRKDTMKFTWAKYWFKLQNTTLYFYTRRDAQPACLRGQYYMYSVQSVRSVTSPDGDFPFEIVMKNGRKKLLSAESEDLRDVWLKLLWKSMQLPGPGHSSSSCIWYDIPELIQRGISASDWIPRDDVLNNPPESAAQGDTNSDSVFSHYHGPTSQILVSTAPAAAPDASSPASPVLSHGDERSSSPEAALGPDRMKLFFPGGKENDSNSISSIYDVPTSRILTFTPPAAPPDTSPASPVLSHRHERFSSPESAMGQDYMTMEKLNLCDSPALEEDEDFSCDAALGPDRMKLFFPGGKENDSDSISSIYDVPTSRILTFTAPAAPPDTSPASPVLSHSDERFSSPESAMGQDYMTMEKLNLCDSPALEEDEDCSCGVETQYMLMADLDDGQDRLGH